MTTENTRESRVRRMAERLGYRLKKSRRRNTKAPDYGRYEVQCRGPNPFGGHAGLTRATLTAVERFLARENRVNVKAKGSRAVNRRKKTRNR